MSRQAGETEGEKRKRRTGIAVTKEMIDAGTEALNESGLLESPTPSAAYFVRKVLYAALEKSDRFYPRTS